jgi:hypothetical protein
MKIALTDKNVYAIFQYLPQLDSRQNQTSERIILWIMPIPVTLDSIMSPGFKNSGGFLLKPTHGVVPVRIR